MNIGKASAIFLNCFKDVEEDKDINANLYSNEEIATAVYEVAHFTTHNGISKDAIISALRWILKTYVIEEEQNV